MSFAVLAKMRNFVQIFYNMNFCKLLLISAITLLLFASCKSEEEKRNDKIISELTDLNVRLAEGVVDYQKLTIYSADSLDYFAIPKVQEILLQYIYWHNEYERYHAEAQRCSDTKLVLEAASYGCGGYRYNAQREAEESANRCLRYMKVMEAQISDILNSSTPLPKEGVWVVEEYKVHKSEGSYTNYHLYHFSALGELLANVGCISSPNPFQIINILIGNMYTSEIIYFKDSE